MNKVFSFSVPYSLLSSRCLSAPRPTVGSEVWKMLSCPPRFFCRGGSSRHQLVRLDRIATEKGVFTSAIMVALSGPVMADSTMLEAA